MIIKKLNKQQYNIKFNNYYKEQFLEFFYKLNQSLSIEFSLFHTPEMRNFIELKNYIFEKGDK